MVAPTALSAHAGRMTILGVVGPSGGAGCSTLAAALGTRAAALGLAAAVVDADPWGGGVQVTMAAEHVPGHRWNDLIEVDGTVSGERLLERLPAAAGCHLLSSGRGTHALDRVVPEAVPAAAFDAVIDALERACDLVIVDWGGQWRSGLGASVLIVPISPRGLADAEVWTGRHGVDDLAGVVTRSRRGERRVADATAAQLGLPLLGELRDDRRVARAARAGQPPGLSARGPLGGLARTLVAAVLAEAGERAS